MIMDLKSGAAVFCVAVITVVFLATELEARGRGGGGTGLSLSTGFRVPRGYSYRAAGV